MNEVRRNQIVGTANRAADAINRSPHSTIGREHVCQLVNIIAELLQEVDDLQESK